MRTTNNLELPLALALLLRPTAAYSCVGQFSSSTLHPRPTVHPRPSITSPARVEQPPRAALFAARKLEIGDVWEGLISKVTDYGFFVKMGHEQHIGLVHISDLVQERLPREDVEPWIEENVGPVGSKVQVEVLKLEFKKAKRTSLRLLDVVQRQHMEDLVFAPGPARQRGGYSENEDDLSE